MSIISKRRGHLSTVDHRQTLNAAQFLELGYVAKTEILRFVDTGRASDVEDLETFFDFVKDRATFANTKRKRIDKGGMPYQYIGFNDSQGSNEVKVVLLGKMKQFIDDFHRGNFYTDFTLEDLVNEAEKA